MELSTEDVRPRVKQGMQWLDENYGLDWREYIDLDTLYLFDPLYCVIGQLYGNYAEIFTELRAPDVAAEHGFTLHKDEQANPGNWNVLQKAWEQELS